MKDIIVLDRHGVIYKGRKAGMNDFKEELAKLTNPRKVKGEIAVAMKDSDVFIGLSGKGLLHADHVRSMAPKAIVFALANPEPEILPEEARRAGAYLIATGRSDFPNQINNALVFPGVFRGALDNKVKTITEKMKLKAAHALASLVSRPSAQKVLPAILDKRIVSTIARTIR